VSQNRLAHQVVADRYELIETVGRGGFGVVWRACDTLLQRHVAVKEIHIPGFLDTEDRADLHEKVLKEARAAARLDHPNAVTVFDVIDDDGHPVIVMELVEAPNLTELVAERGPLSPAETARIGLEVLAVLTAAHARGIVHRDVKPGNVMVADSGRVRLGDFGVAAILDEPTLSTSGAVTGSPAYMAPEQATNKGAVAESDLWSLGATMYFAVEGRPPFDKGAPLPTLTSIVTDPPRPTTHAGPLAPVLGGLLVKDPSARLTAEQLRDQLAQVAEGGVPAPAAEAGTDDTMVFEAPVFEAPAVEAPAVEAPVFEAPPVEAPVFEAPEPVVEAPPPVAPPVTAAPRRPAAAPPPVAPRRRRPLGWIAGVAALVVAALVALALTAGNDDSNPPPSASGSPSSTAPRSGGTSAPATNARPKTQTPTSDTVTYTDPQTGFTIAQPKDWTVRTDSTLTDFRDPATGAYLRVDHVQPARPSPEGAWYELETSFAASNDNYRRIRIEPTTYAGYRAAVWEFTYTDGGADLHVSDLGFITPKYGFALYFQTKVADWDRLQPTLQAFKDSFKAPQ
jgi:hypothetical protein